jgi:uncharacterized protein YndB with AHSA1/START domain
MQFETSIDIDADPSAVWAALTDVERWPEWTASMTEVVRLDEGPFSLGSKARIRQPKLPVVVWEVVDLEPERAFSWTSKAPGTITRAEHRVVPRPGGGVDVTLTVRLTGLLAPIVWLLTSRVTRRYVRMEAEGLKQRCEEARPR